MGDRCTKYVIFITTIGLPWWLNCKESTWNAGDMDGGAPVLISGSEIFPGVGNGNPLQYSCLENPMDRGACWATVHGIAKELDTTERLNNKKQQIATMPRKKWYFSPSFFLYQRSWGWNKVLGVAYRIVSQINLTLLSPITFSCISHVSYCLVTPIILRISSRYSGFI